jgi:eukaryotic-like serine/threonine-protein kinase
MASFPDALASALADRYRIEKQLGQGGMATVWLAHDIANDREVALKVLNPELSRTVGADRFRREIRVAGSFDHPNILTVFDSGEVEEHIWFTMPLVRGETVADLLARREPVPLERALAITRAVGAALAVAHERGVVHRDIKPDNILLEDDRVLVADFGVARAVSEMNDKLTATGMVVGTVTYMSTEQAAGEKEIDGRSDQYSLACVLYEMVSGELPFKGPTPTAAMMRRFAGPPKRLRPFTDIPEVVENAMFRALEREPEARYATVTEFIDALDGKVATTAPPPPPPVPVPPPSSTKPAGAKSGCLGVLAGWIILGTLLRHLA